jgi:tetratricopeptide (TPR) repeat protein
MTPITITMEKGRHLIRVSMGENWMPYIEEKEIDRDYDLEVKLQPRNEFSYEKGKEAFQKEDNAAARHHFKDATSGGKVVAEGFFYLALLDDKKQDATAAIENLKTYINLNPPHGDFVMTLPVSNPKEQNYGVLFSQYLLGEYYRKAYNWGSAATAFKLAIPEKERFTKSDTEATQANINALRARVKKNPEDYAALIQLGYLYELKGTLFQSMMSYRDGAIALFKQSTEFMNTLGRLGGL